MAITIYVLYLYRVVNIDLKVTDYFTIFIFSVFAFCDNEKQMFVEIANDAFKNVSKVLNRIKWLEIKKSELNWYVISVILERYMIA